MFTFISTTDFLADPKHSQALAVHLTSALDDHTLSRHRHMTKMTNEIRLRVRSLMDSPALAGAGPGRELFARLIEALGDPVTPPQPVFVDCDRVEMMTASFVRESIFAYRARVRAEHPDLYPVIANANPLVLEEVQIMTERLSAPILVCDLDKRGKAKHARKIGRLDDKAQRTFDLVSKLARQGETDVRALIQASGADDVAKPTAWSNRLSALVELGLIIEIPDGRAKRYRPVLQEA